MCNVLKIKGIGNENKEFINIYLIIVFCIIRILNCKIDMKFNNYKYIFFFKNGD